MVSTKAFRKPLWGLAARLCLVAAPVFACAADAPSVVWPNASKIATIGDSTLSVRITSRDAGAIDGLVWRGKQFVSSSDHGREIQMAAAFSDKHRECFNPTEAGSIYDGLGATSTSRLLSLKVEPRRVTTETRAVYWLDPTDSARCPATDGPKDGPLSRDILRKVVTIGAVGLPNVIEFQSTFVVPELRTLGGFEAPTGYMPPEFSNFWIYDPAKDQLKPVVGELAYQNDPIIFATHDGRFAMGNLCAAAKHSGELFRTVIHPYENGFPDREMECLLQKKQSRARRAHFHRLHDDRLS